MVNLAFTTFDNSSEGQNPKMTLFKWKGHWEKDPTLIRDHSASGWTTIETFCHSLADAYRGNIPPGRQVHLILHSCSVHRSEEIREYARRLGIKLWFIPPGHPDALQPLDRAVFGPIESICRHRFEEQCRQSPTARITKSAAIQILTEIWQSLSPAAIHSGWAIREDDCGPMPMLLMEIRKIQRHFVPCFFIFPAEIERGLN
jgi:hypothetical protein